MGASQDIRGVRVLIKDAGRGIYFPELPPGTGRAFVAQYWLQVGTKPRTECEEVDRG